MATPIIPGHPNLKYNIIVMPINERGKTIEAKNIGIFN
jgi:hypothetical protein